MHHTAESSSTVCITLRSQVTQPSQKLGGVFHTTRSNCTTRSQNWNLCNSLVAFKGTIRRNSFRGKYIYHKKKIWRNFFSFAKLKILTPLCHAHRGVEFFELCDWITQQNGKRIWKYFSLFIRGPHGFESCKQIEVKNLVTHYL